MTPVFKYSMSMFHVFLAALLTGINAAIGWDLIGGLGVFLNTVAAIIWYVNAQLEGDDG